MQADFRGFRGMQVHAVPEADRAIDASGRKLPWAYDASSTTDGLENREPVEKGPFGRSQRRSRSGLSRSRSRTAEPRREEDRIRAEQLAAEDAVFGSLRKTVKDDGAGRGREVMSEVDANAVAQSATSPRDAGDQEATEVMLLGFAEDSQWAALDFYERVSGGSILEDYDRQPPGQRYDISRSLSRATSQKSLSRAALKKKNTFAGGRHWIKITFDSRGAAELACARSPHILKGGLVYAEPWQGRGPGKDEFIPATQAGAQINDPELPSTFSTGFGNTGHSPNGSSTTATSATAANRREPTAIQNEDNQHPTSAVRLPPHTPLSVINQSNAIQPPATPRRRGRIEGSTPARLLPASSALLSKPPKKPWAVWAPWNDVIGSSVPKKEDGSFDHSRASLYWRLVFMLDLLLGTDLCGIKSD